MADPPFRRAKKPADQAGLVQLASPPDRNLRWSGGCAGQKPVTHWKPKARFVGRTVGVSPQQRGPVRAGDPHVLAGAGASPICAGTSFYDAYEAGLRGQAAMHLLRLHGIPASPIRRTGMRRDARPTRSGYSSTSRAGMISPYGMPFIEPPLQTSSFPCHSAVFKPSE